MTPQINPAWSRMIGYLAKHWQFSSPLLATALAFVKVGAASEFEPTTMLAITSAMGPVRIVAGVLTAPPYPLIIAAVAALWVLTLVAQRTREFGWRLLITAAFSLLAFAFSLKPHWWIHSSLAVAGLIFACRQSSSLQRPVSERKRTGLRRDITVAFRRFVQRVTAPILEVGKPVIVSIASLAILLLLIRLARWEPNAEGMTDALQIRETRTLIREIIYFVLFIGWLLFLSTMRRRGEVLIRAFILFVAGLLFVSMALDPHIWLPKEVIVAQNFPGVGEEVDIDGVYEGYVLSSDGQWTIFLQSEFRKVRLIMFEDVTVREVCKYGRRYEFWVTELDSYIRARHLGVFEKGLLGFGADVKLCKDVEAQLRPKHSTLYLLRWLLPWLDIYF